MRGENSVLNKFAMIVEPQKHEFLVALNGTQLGGFLEASCYCEEVLHFHLNMDSTFWYCVPDIGQKY